MPSHRKTKRKKKKRLAAPPPPLPPSPLPPEPLIVDCQQPIDVFEKGLSKMTPAPSHTANTPPSRRQTEKKVRWDDPVASGQNPRHRTLSQSLRELRTEKFVDRILASVVPRWNKLNPFFVPSFEYDKYDIWQPLNSLSPYNTPTQRFVSGSSSKMGHFLLQTYGLFSHWGFSPANFPPINISATHLGFLVDSEWKDSVDSFWEHYESTYCIFPPRPLKRIDDSLHLNPKPLSPTRRKKSLEGCVLRKASRGPSFLLHHQLSRPRFIATKVLLHKVLRLSLHFR